MENLKDFMLLFSMELKPESQPSKEELMQIKKAWGQWISSIGEKARLVSSHQLGFEGKVIHSNSKISEGFARNEEKSISGNLVLKAVDLEEACQMATDCPILSAGGTVEVRNTINVF